MSKYNPFAMKAGFKFIRPERPKSYESALRVFQRHFRSDPGDNEAIVKELFAMSESRRRRALRDLVADYHKNSSTGKSWAESWHDDSGHCRQSGGRGQHCEAAQGHSQPELYVSVVWCVPKP